MRLVFLCTSLKERVSEKERESSAAHIIQYTYYTYLALLNKTLACWTQSFPWAGRQAGRECIKAGFFYFLIFLCVRVGSNNRTASSLSLNFASITIRILKTIKTTRVTNLQLKFFSLLAQNGKYTSVRNKKNIFWYFFFLGYCKYDVDEEVNPTNLPIFQRIAA